jgi:hypothetical protein
MLLLLGDSVTKILMEVLFEVMDGGDVLVTSCPFY